MTLIFQWVGFICLSLITISLAFYLCVALFEIVMERTKIFGRVFQIMNKFYESFPNRRRNPHRYVLTLYDYETKVFVDHVYLNSYGQTDEEYQKQWDEMRKRHVRIT